jgi:hypothetical protein
VLGVLGRGIHPMDENDLNDAPDETVEEGQGHDRQASPSLLWLVKLGQGVSGPFKPRMIFGTHGRGRVFRWSRA